MADSGNHKIKRLTVESNVVTKVDLVTGPSTETSSGDVSSASSEEVRLLNPTGLAVFGAFLFVSDSGNHKVKPVTVATGAVAVAYGSTQGFVDSSLSDGAANKFNGLQGLAVNGTGLFIADKGNHKIRRCELGSVVAVANGTTCTTFVGSPTGTAAGTADGIDVTAARFTNPAGLAFDYVGHLFVVDIGNSRVRKVSTSMVVTTVAGGAAGYVEQATASTSVVMYDTARFSSPTDLYFPPASPETGLLVNSGNHRIRQLRTIATRRPTSTVTVTTMTNTT